MQAIAVDGGYRISRNGPLASGVDHCSWVVLGGMAQDGPSMSMHISLNPEMNFAHFGRLELGLGRHANRPWF